MKVLVTGGAGYIGSHIVRILCERGDDVVVVDDLSSGRSERVLPPARLMRLDLTAPDATATLTSLLRDCAIDAAIHVAAKKQVPESIVRSTWYYQQNVGGLIALLTAVETAGTPYLLFSSSAAAYGLPVSGVAQEDDPPQPLSPYGETKLVGEWLCRDATRAWGLRTLSLRYFNVAGAGWPDLQDHAQVNLIPIVLRHALEERPVPVFGDDYPTPDGTCVRDYIHVLDLADAHVAGLDHLASEKESGIDLLNVGTGHGTSVREVLEAARAVTGRQVKEHVVERRAGDPPSVVADTQRIHQLLGWFAQHGLDEMLRSALPQGQG